MAVKIKTKEGKRKEPSQKSARQAFLEGLSGMPTKKLGLGTDTMVAYHLDRLQATDREKIDNGVMPWVRPYHYTTGQIGEGVLPEGSSFKIEGGPAGGSASVTVKGETACADASSAFAAWAMCLLELKDRGLV
jgi:hypothetical protein